MSRKVSEIGVYVERGETADADIFYHSMHNRPNAFMKVPAASVFMPKMVTVVPEDRGDWVAVGTVGDWAYEVVMTTETFSRQSRRISESLADEVIRERRQKEHCCDLLDVKSRELLALSRSDVAKGDQIKDLENRLFFIRQAVKEM